MSPATRSMSQAEVSRCDLVDKDSNLPRTSSWSSPQEMAGVIEFGSIIGPKSLFDMTACPCCRQCLDEKQQTLDGTSLSSPIETRSPSSTNPNANKCGDDVVDDDDEDEDEDNSLRLPGVVEEGVAYYPRRILVEGWLHKKGTGKDWLGSRSWKARWARLVMARIDGYKVDLPLLMIYWYNTTPTPSTVISLESTVVLPVDMPDKDRWDAFRFEIRSARTAARNGSNPITRIFSAPRKARDTWVYVISQALLKYEKENAKARKAAAVASESSRSRSPSSEDLWSGDRFLPANRIPVLSSPEMKRIPSGSPPASPPSSPRSRTFPRLQEKCPIPRPSSSSSLGQYSPSRETLL